MNEYYALIASGLVKLVFGIVAVLVTYYLVPWLKEKRLYDTVAKLVKAAEKMADAGAISKEDKKKYVTDALVGMGVKVTPFVEALIEAAVEELDILKTNQMIVADGLYLDGDLNMSGLSAEDFEVNAEKECAE